MNSIKRKIHGGILKFIVSLSLLGLLFSFPLFSYPFNNRCMAADDGLKSNLRKAMEQVSERTNKRTAIEVVTSFLGLGRSEEFETGQLLLLSLAGSSTLTAGMKYIVNRKRPTPPNERKNSSFPSGHATAAFSAAAAIAFQYPKLKIPVYLLAGTVAYSRLYLDRHYGSDIIAGALIGHYTAKYVIKFRKHITFSGRGIIGAFIEGNRAGLVIGF